MTPILRADGLTKSYGGRLVLAGVSLSVNRGEVVAVLGPSGSGKTTLFRCLTRLTLPDSGTIELDGAPLLSLRGRAIARARRKIGVVFQDFNLIGRLSARDNVLAGRLADAPLWRVLARRFSPADNARAVEALDAVGLGDHLDQRADTLSGGQQQRVAIARALAQESAVLLADEPVASLDPDSAHAILDLMRDLARAQRLAVLCTLHQRALAREFADRVLVMEQGRLAPADAVSAGERRPLGSEQASP